jgi:FKBP-type peptidyl-prolyl cis-trans isomerase
MKKIIFTILAVAVVVVSCEKQDNENTYVSQEQSIDKYITGLVSTYNYKVVRLNGSNRVVISSGASADSLEAGDSLYFHYSGYLFSGGKGSLFATNDTTVAKANSFVTDGAARKIVLGNDGFISGLHNGLHGVRTGENCYIIFSGKYVYGNSVMFNLSRLSPLLFDITVDKIVKN